MSDLIDRAQAQTELQFAAKRYTVAHEAHGEGKVVWSDNLISVTDAIDALRKVPSAQPEIHHCIDCTLYNKSECLMAFENACWAEPYGYCHMFTREEADEDE